MKTLLRITIAFILFVAFTSCDDGGSDAPPPPDPIKIELTATEKQIVADEKTNAMRFFSKVAQKEAFTDAAIAQDVKENFMISPYSLNVALAMTRNGAKGETKTAIEDALGYSTEYGDAVNAYHKKMAAALIETDPTTKLLIGNSIWYRETAQLKSAFQQTNEDAYAAQIEGVDFGDANTKERINKWCEKQTKGLIKDVVQQTNPEDLIYLINALYFKGIWSEDYKFQEADTKQEDFTLESGVKTKVAMMHQKTEMNYTENENFTAVSLPYGNGAYSMIILLPKENKNMVQVAEELAQPAVFSQQLSSFSRAKVDLFLPKFKFEYKIELNNMLKIMGMEKAFASDADFSDAFETMNFFISKVEQFTYVDVNEKGTEAAAVTVVVGATSAGAPQKEVTFRADKAFAFFIQENSTGSILFAGKVGNPNVQ